MKMVTAEQLAIEAQRGCRDSFGELVNRYSVPLRRFLQMQTQNLADADDLTQDCFARAWENIGKYRARWHFSTWLFAIGYRLACNHHFKNREHSPRLAKEPLVKPPDLIVQENEMGELLWRCVIQLPRHQADALWLKYVEGMSIKEIARVTRRSQVGVKVTLYRARSALAKKLMSHSSPISDLFDTTLTTRRTEAI